MNTDNLRRLLDEATPRPWKDADIFYYVVAATERKDAALIVELVNNADELLAENERLRAALKPMTEGTHWITDEDVETARAALEQKP